MENYTPEIGQMFFGQPFKQYKVTKLLEAALWSISREWKRVMWNINQKNIANPFDSSGAKWKCNEFEMEAYSWNDEYEQPYNFKWGDIEISWYKYLGRGMSVNKEVSLEEINDLLDSCLEAIRNYEKGNKKK